MPASLPTTISQKLADSIASWTELVALFEMVPSIRVDAGPSP